MAVAAVPEWLTSDFLKECLESDTESFTTVTITNYSVEPAIPPGNNYGSMMWRVKVFYKCNNDVAEQQISAIVKAPLRSGYVEQYGDAAMAVNRKETRFYNEFIRESYKFLKHNIVPKHYISPDPLCVVMEDLKASGFEMVDRHELLDYNHCLLYIEASAKLHALSVAVNSVKPEIIQSLVFVTSENKSKEDEFLKKMLSNCILCFCAYLEDKINCKDYLEIFTELTQNDMFWKIYQEMEKSNRSFKAIRRTDPWCTNMMFKYSSSGSVIDIKLLDFQTVEFASPIEELVCFMWCSVKPEVRATKIDNVYRLYSDSLTRYLVQFRCSERVSFEEILSEVSSFSPIVIKAICVMIPLFLANEMVDMGNFVSDEISERPIKESKLYKLYEGSAFQKLCPIILDQAAKEGVFDYIRKRIDFLK